MKQEHLPIKPLLAPLFADNPQFSDFEQITTGEQTTELYLVTYQAQVMNSIHRATVWVGRRYVGHSMVQVATGDTRREVLEKVS